MSRFVSGGTNDEVIERDEEWKKAQQEVEERHRQKAEAARQDGGKSLYETLQANKGECDIYRRKLHRHRLTGQVVDKLQSKNNLRSLFG